MPETNGNPPPLNGNVTIGDVVEHYGLSEFTIFRMIKTGRIPATKRRAGSRLFWVLDGAAVHGPLCEAREWAVRHGMHRT